MHFWHRRSLRRPQSGNGTSCDESACGPLPWLWPLPGISPARLILEGTAPKNALIKMDADPACASAAKTPQMQETFMVGEAGAFQNVFVYVKDGLGNRTFPTPTEVVTLDQQDCRYHPHVLGIRVGQPLEMLNSDPTVHNIHAMATTQPAVQRR